MIIIMIREKQHNRVTASKCHQSNVRQWSDCSDILQITVLVLTEGNARI